MSMQATDGVHIQIHPAEGEFRSALGPGYMLGCGVLHVVFRFTPTEFSGPATIVKATVPTLVQLGSEPP